jgi:putative ATP-dependent endonuclease of OLD family
MKLSRLRIRNFRCFQKEITINFDYITALIGRNDSGKSTILDALDIFLNDNDPDRDDASKNGDRSDLAIICEFSELPDEVILDDEVPTNFGSEYLLNLEGRLEIRKCYSGDLQKPKCKSIEAYAIHPSIEEAKDLLQLRNNDLKKRAKELSIDLSNIDQRVNAQMRMAIRSSFTDLKLVPSTIPLNNENTNKIWSELRKYLPAFALFKSDRPSTDQDPEAQDPLKAAVKEAIKAKEAELATITKFIHDEVQKIANLTLEKLREMDPTLAKQLNPTFTPPKWDSLFKASITSDEDIPINKRGSGVKRLILLNFFRAKVEQTAQQSGRTTLIYAIEEPETSQHPNNQRILLKALTTLSSEAQVIISTHTPMLARSLPDKCLRYIHVDNDKPREILIGGPQTNNLFARSLGVLPDSSIKLFIGVEGPNDISFLQNISTALRKDAVDIIDIEQMELDGELIFFPFGGANLAVWSSRLQNLNKPEFHLVDRDTIPPAPPKYKNYLDEVNARPGCKAFSTGKKEIENYLHKNAIMAAYKNLGINILLKENFNSYDDVPLTIAKLVHEASESPKKWEELDIKSKEEKESKAKKFLCGSATKYMTNSYLNEIDTQGELINWFSIMKELILI